MAYDLVTAKTRLGIAPGDTTQDEAITIAMNSSLAIAERYCYRQFFYDGETAKFYFTQQRRFHVDRYPIDEIVSVSGSTNDYVVNRAAGWVDFGGVICVDELAIEFKGGYLPSKLPADLETALWEMFDTTYAIQTGTSTAGDSGPVQSVTVPDVGTIRYDTGGGGPVEAVGYIPAGVAGILNTYRRFFA